MAKSLDIYAIVFAEEYMGKNKYYVYPISKNDSLVKIAKVDKEGNEVGKPFKLLRSDLFEFYVLYEYFNVMTLLQDSKE